jgi:hypothetical protein
MNSVKNHDKFKSKNNEKKSFMNHNIKENNTNSLHENEYLYERYIFCVNNNSYLDDIGYICINELDRMEYKKPFFVQI